jgi:tricarballylate dehydrogenase
MHTTADLSSFDILVIGGGNAALCAALCAVEQGASVLILESAPRHMRGGNSRHTRNLRAMHEAPTDVLIEAYPEDEYYTDLLRVTGGQTTEALARLTIRDSAACTAWMKQYGVRFQPSLTGTLHLGRTNAFFLGGGKAVVNELFAAAERRGVQVRYDAEVSEVRLEGDTFKSATAIIAGQPVEIRAKALVAASGGFESNLEWLEQAWGPAARNFLIRGTPYNTGKVLKSLLAQGVRSIGDPTQCHAVAIDARAPKFDGGIVTRLDSVSLGIVVNRDGKRFYDEGEDFWPKRYAIWGRLVAGQPDQIGYSIVDAKAIGKFMPSVFPPVRANSIRELATKLGVPPEQTERTVAEFNRAIKPGTFDHAVLDDCCTAGLTPDKTHWARPIDTPPYLGFPLRPGITFTYLGVGVNEQAMILMADGRPSQNMFAAGEIMAGNVLGKGYLAGIGMTIGTVFGRIAGRAAGAYVKH